MTTSKKRNRRCRRRPEPLLSSSVFNSQSHANNSVDQQLQQTTTTTISTANSASQPLQPATTDSSANSIEKHFQPATRSRTPAIHSAIPQATSPIQSDKVDLAVDLATTSRTEQDPSHSEPPPCFWTPHPLPDCSRAAERHISSDESLDFSSDDSDDDSVDRLFAQYGANTAFDSFNENDDQNEENPSQNLSDPSVVERTVIGPGELSENMQRGMKALSTLRKYMSRPTFLGVISLYGKARYTLDNYAHLVALMQDGDNGIILPSSSTMRKFVFPRLLSNNFVQSSIKVFPTKRNYKMKLCRSSKKRKRQAEAVVVLPSEWAKMDVRSLHVLREIACIDSCRCKRSFGATDLRVDSSSHVINRAANSRHSDTLWVNHQGVPIPSSQGMTIRIHTPNENSISDLRNQIPNFNSKEVYFKKERCTAFDVKIISTVHVRYSLNKGIYLEEGLQPKFSDERMKFRYNNCVHYLRTLCEERHRLQSDNNREVSQANPECSAQTRRQRQRQQNSRVSRIDSSTPYLIPSDLLTIVQLCGVESFGVVLSRFWIDRIDDERNFFLFIHEESEPQTSCTSIPTFGAATLVQNVPQRTVDNETGPTCRTTGTLPNGMRFYMYRIILYADDFNPRSTLFPKGSVGGVYMNPSSLHLRSRRSQYTIRTVSLTPPGVSTNSIIDYLIEDLVTGSLDGFECVDAFGNTVRVFFDVMGFTGDYPASSAVIDHKGHNATAPCTACGFTFNKISGMPVYAFTTSITSRHSAYRRTQERTCSIRAAGLTDDHEKILGMTHLESEGMTSTNECPLLKFSSQYNEVLEGHHAPPEFAADRKDGYSLNLIAPDHLISGLFKGILTITFIQLPNDQARDELTSCLIHSLAEFGFQSQTVLFKYKKKKLVSALSMSTLYCILTVLPSTLKALDLLDAHPAKRLVVNMYRLFTLAFWWPNLAHDGRTAWRFVHGTHMNLYHRSLQVLAANFVKSVHKYSNSFPDLATHVDKPNTHRILELVHHTIPLFNHVAYICELVFESAHQPLKFFLSRDHSVNSHIYSVQLVLAKDWMVRLCNLWTMYNDEGETSMNRRHALLGLLRLIIGKDMDDINWQLFELSECFTALSEHVEHLMRGTVERRFMKWYSDSIMNYYTDPSWGLVTPKKTHVLPSTEKTFLTASMSKLAQLSLRKHNELQLCHKAILHRGFGSQGKGSHERLCSGDVIQVLLPKGSKHKQFLTNFISEEGIPHFFIIGGFGKCTSGTKWAIVKQCSTVFPSAIGQLPDHTQPPYIEVISPNFFHPETQSSVCFVELDNNIRKVGVLHNCAKEGKCKFSNGTRGVQHSATTLGGGNFFILTRSMGYPPRRS